MRHILKEIKNFDRKVKQKADSIIEWPNTRPNLTELQILDYLIKNQGKQTYQKDLAKALNLKKSSITERLDIMEEKKMIERINDEDDSRKKRIVLSKKIKEKKNEIVNIFRAIEDKVVQDISEDKINIFFEVLDKMSDNLERGKDEVNL